MIKNKKQVNDGVEVWVKQMSRVATESYQRNCAGLLKELLYSTPQFTGRAVANWRMGIGAPNMRFDPSLGEQAEIRERKDQTGSYVAFSGVKRTGDREWIDVAWNRARRRFRNIKLGDRVFFTNNVQGDDDGGKSSKYYLDSLQNPIYWSDKLRLVNMPYQTAAETLLIYNWKSFADAGATGLEDLV